MYTPEVIARYPHDPQAFTQGLEFRGERLYESTGLYGHSSLRVVESATGRVLRQREVPREFFAEGITVFDGRIYQLTYTSQRCFVYDAETLAPLREHAYAGEGWGLTHDDRSLIMSDGSNQLRFIDPSSFAELRRVRVFDGDRAVDQLNELEYVDGEVYANVWHADRIARIDPASGRVVGWIDLSSLRRMVDAGDSEAVLNGIALAPATRHLFVTGKLWPTMFEIRLRR